MEVPISYNDTWTTSALQELASLDIKTTPKSHLNPKYPKMHGEFVYKDCQFVNWTTLEKIQRVEDDFTFFEDDVLIATFPKSGTTIMQEILWLLCNNVDTEAAKKEKVFVRVPFIEENYTNVFPGDPNEKYPIDYLECLPRPRIMKSHLPFRYLSHKFHASGMKIIWVLRNPKDTAVSYYHFYRGTVDYGPYRGSWSDFLEMWLDGWIASGDWLTVVSEWWEAAKRFPDRIHVVHYESLLRNPIEEICKVADFVHRPCDRNVASKVAEHVKFDNMSKNDATNYSGVGGFTPDFKFMRKGQIGDWKNWFTVQQNEAFDRQYQPRLAAIGLKLDEE